MVLDDLVKSKVFEVYASLDQRSELEDSLESVLLSLEKARSICAKGIYGYTNEAREWLWSEILASVITEIVTRNCASYSRFMRVFCRVKEMVSASLPVDAP